MIVASVRGIDAGQRIVEDHHGAVLHERPRNGRPLLLTSGERDRLAPRSPGRSPRGRRPRRGQGLRSPRTASPGPPPGAVAPIAMFSASVLEKRTATARRSPSRGRARRARRRGYPLPLTNTVPRSGRCSPVRTFIERRFAAADRPGDPDEVPGPMSGSRPRRDRLAPARVGEGEVPRFMKKETESPVSRPSPRASPRGRRGCLDPAHGADPLLDQGHDPAEGEHGEGELA